MSRGQRARRRRGRGHAGTPAGRPRWPARTRRPRSVRRPAATAPSGCLRPSCLIQRVSRETAAHPVGLGLPGVQAIVDIKAGDEQREFAHGLPAPRLARDEAGSGRRALAGVSENDADTDSPAASSTPARGARAARSAKEVRVRSAAASSLVLLHDSLRNPTSRWDCDTVAARPLPQLDEVELALRLRPVGLRLVGLTRARRGRRSALASSRADVAVERLAERSCVPLRQVDLVGGAVQGERHRLGGRAAVEVINQSLGHFDSHAQHSLSTEGCPQRTPIRHVSHLMRDVSEIRAECPRAERRTCRAVAIPRPDAGQNRSVLVIRRTKMVLDRVHGVAAATDDCSTTRATGTSTWCSGGPRSPCSSASGR